MHAAIAGLLRTQMGMSVFLDTLWQVERDRQSGVPEAGQLLTSWMQVSWPEVLAGLLQEALNNEQAASEPAPGGASSGNTGRETSSEQRSDSVAEGGREGSGEDLVRMQDDRAAAKESEN